MVRLNGELLVKPSQTIASDGIFHIEQASIRWVSRGGLKLEAALNAFNVPDLSGAVCLDAGASTGGFSDVLLSRGASHIYAVDVGHGQLAKKLASDPRIINLEKPTPVIYPVNLSLTTLILLSVTCPSFPLPKRWRRQWN